LEESVEHLVRLYFESRGFLVVTNQKFKIGKGTPPEVDVIAVNPKTGEKILAEVKAWKIKRGHITKILSPEDRKKYPKYQRRLRIVNDREFREKLIEKVEERYGEGFKVYLFAAGIQKKYEKEIMQVLKEEGITFVSIVDVIKELIKLEEPYSKDPAIQLLIYLKNNDLLKL